MGKGVLRRCRPQRVDVAAELRTPIVLSFGGPERQQSVFSSLEIFGNCRRRSSSPFWDYANRDLGSPSFVDMDVGTRWLLSDPRYIAASLEALGTTVDAEERLWTGVCLRQTLLRLETVLCSSRCLSLRS